MNTFSPTTEPTMNVDVFGNKSWSTSIGVFHREGDLPAIELRDGTKFWYRNGERHREGNRPAVEYSDGAKSWYVNNILHREDGPAIVTADGDEFWYLNGEKLSEEEFKERMAEKEALTKPCRD